MAPEWRGFIVIAYYKTSGGALRRVARAEVDCWVDVVNPTDAEQRLLLEDLGVVPEFLRAALDEEESAHIDIDDEAHQRMVIVDCPVEGDLVNPHDPNSVQYGTQPLAVLFLQEKGIMLTISLQRNPVVESMLVGPMEHLNTAKRVEIFFEILLREARIYPGYLANIGRQFARIEARLRSSMTNAELISLLDIQKSLVYFSTSLSSEKAVLDRIATGKVFAYDEDEGELLNDVLVEIAQATESCNIYTTIVANTMGAFGNVISNNLNTVMKALAIITVIMTIPNIVFGFYGMNTESLPLAGHWLYPLGMAVVACMVALAVCVHQGIFKK